jgi:hypothetical protein
MHRGQRDSLIGKLQERYGWVKEEAQRKADEWIKVHSGKRPRGAFKPSAANHAA